ncbi:MAG: hypothetical protein K5886_05600 [Lachnospiraceae bacterium]|nr:hypothetical protein [Lachnospiraceae bacterium]
MENKKVKLVIVTKDSDYSNITQDYNKFFEYLPVKEIIMVGSKHLSELMEKDRENGILPDKVTFMYEEELVSSEKMMAAVKDHLTAGGYDIADNSRLGWYYQQFLKMQFSRICDDEYYMAWDIDTVPLRKTGMFTDDGHPIFDLKTEYQPGYFKTIKKLFGFDKIIKKSFIAEHMLFNVGYMKEMLDEIEALPIKGEAFYEKIMYSLDYDNMKLGFSEFETFGTWMGIRHPDVYKLREWHSLRKGGFFLNSKDLDEDAKKWLAGSFDAITFEGYNQVDPSLAEMFNNEEYRTGLSAQEFYDIALESGYFGIMTEDGLVKGEIDVRWPF